MSGVGASCLPLKLKSVVVWVCVLVGGDVVGWWGSVSVWLGVGA